MLRAPFLPRPISLMKAAAGKWFAGKENSEVGGVVMVMAKAYTGHQLFLSNCASISTRAPYIRHHHLVPGDRTEEICDETHKTCSENWSTDYRQFAGNRHGAPGDGLEPPRSALHYPPPQGGRHRFLHVSQLSGGPQRLHHPDRQLCAPAGCLRRPELFRDGPGRPV